LFAFDEPVDKRLIADLDRLAVVLARQRPAWGPGTRQAYHAISLGFYQSELLRRVDPHHRSLGQFFHEELATPLDLDFYIRLPESIPDARLATLELSSVAQAVLHYPLRLTLAAMHPRSPLHRSMISNPGTLIALNPARIYARDFEVPSGGGVGTARAIARAYSVFATGGRELGLREDTLRQLMAPAVPPLRGFHDACLQVEVQFSLGFTKPAPTYPFGSPSAFGAPGAGGSFGFADPEAEIGYGYVMNRMGAYLEDPRDRALREAMYRAIDALPPVPARDPDAEFVRNTPRAPAMSMVGVGPESADIGRKEH
jgi:CubicO group peptidase (beta-lactamase class C family)